MAHAEPDTSSRPSLNRRHCGRLKHIVTTWIQTNSQECAYIWNYMLYSWSCIVTAWTSWPNVSRRRFERLFSVSSRYRHSNVSVSSPSRLSLQTLTFQSCHHTSHLQPCLWVTVSYSYPYVLIRNITQVKRSAISLVIAVSTQYLYRCSHCTCTVLLK